MDLYSFYSSMDAVIEYLERVSPDDAKLARKRYANFERFQGEGSAYGYATGFGLAPSFEKEVISTLVDLQRKEEFYLKGEGGLIDGDGNASYLTIINNQELFYTQQNAALVVNAEEYYRKMYHADDRTWNLRDKHMADCVANIFDFHKAKFKNTERSERAVLWVTPWAYLSNN
jgi:erythromycin esterase-like protein